MYPELGPDPGPHQKSGWNQLDKMVGDELNRLSWPLHKGRNQLVKGLTDL